MINMYVKIKQVHLTLKICIMIKLIFKSGYSISNSQEKYDDAEKASQKIIETLSVLHIRKS